MNNLDLDMIEWKEFNIKDIFDIFTGSLINSSRIKDGFDPRITATDNNNGISIFTNKLSGNARYFSNFISISFLGSVFYQKYKSSLDMKIHGIKPKNIKLNKYIALFLIPCIKKFTFKYNYGYQLSTSILKTQKLKLPIDAQENPNWRFMEYYIKQKQKEQLQKIIDYYKKRLIYSSTINKKLSLSDVEWKAFKFSQLFNNYHGKRLVKTKRIKGLTPMLTAGENNNGISSFISNYNMEKHDDFISIDMFGNAFYHPYIATGDDNIYFFVNNNITKNAKMFIVTCINKQKSKYSYGKQFRQNNANNSYILLPIDINRNPNWRFMEDYVKRIEESKIYDILKYYEKVIEDCDNI